MKISIVVTKLKHKLNDGLPYYVEHPNELNNFTKQWECWFSPQTLLELINRYANQDQQREGENKDSARV